MMPTLKEMQKMVHALEEEKGFNRGQTKDELIRNKIIWLGEEFGELCHAFKHGDMDKVAEEAVDINFFTSSILEILGADGDKIFLEKLEKNRGRHPVMSGKEMHFDKVSGKINKVMQEHGREIKKYVKIINALRERRDELEDERTRMLGKVIGIIDDYEKRRGRYTVLSRIRSKIKKLMEGKNHEKKI